MSDDDKKNPRDNVSPKLKPKDAKNENVAPAGHMGIENNPSSLDLGSGVRVVNVSYQMVVQENEASPEQTELQAEVQDTRPIAIATGDKDIDAQSEAEGFQLKTQDEINELSGVEQNGEPLEPEQSANSFDEMMQDDGSTQFQRTNDRDVNQHFEDRGETPVPQSLGLDAPDAEGPYNRPRGTPEDLKASFNEAAAYSNEALKSQQQERD
ncbi:MAG: hypothetical protein ACRBBQ_12325 [Cognatishimia sp.]